MPVDETEAAFENEFWDHWEAGIYVEVTSGEPLFASDDKHDAGMGPLTTLCKVRFLRIADIGALSSIGDSGLLDEAARAAMALVAGVRSRF